eukprot:COSAG01_NODE_20356_length_958_cov_1.228172_1_plen_201_part_10
MANGDGHTDDDAAPTPAGEDDDAAPQATSPVGEHRNSQQVRVLQVELDLLKRQMTMQALVASRRQEMMQSMLGAKDAKIEAQTRQLSWKQAEHRQLSRRWEREAAAASAGARRPGSTTTAGEAPPSPRGEPSEPEPEPGPEPEPEPEREGAVRGSGGRSEATQPADSQLGKGDAGWAPEADVASPSPSEGSENEPDEAAAA